MEAKKFPRTPSRNEFHNIRIIFQSFFLRWSGRGTTRKVRAMKVCTTMEGSKMATRAWGRKVYNWIPKQPPRSLYRCRESRPERAAVGSGVKMQCSKLISIQLISEAEIYNPVAPAQTLHNVRWCLARRRVSHELASEGAACKIDKVVSTGQRCGRGRE